MHNLSSAEITLGKMAAEKIKVVGGQVTFEQYDKMMLEEKYFVPFNWAAGWGLPHSLKKANDDKLCVFAACKLGLVNQTDTGYCLSDIM